MASAMAVRGCVLALVLLAVVPNAYSQRVCNNTLLQDIQANPQLQQLALVITAARLTDLLNTTSLNVTLLAPNNAAFNGTGGFNSILTSNNLTLADVTGEDNNRAASILLYHLIPLNLTAAQLTNGQSIQTSLEGARNLTVSKSNVTPTAPQVTFVGPVNNATVVAADVRSCNSIIHVVNRVLLPNATLANIPEYNGDNTPVPGVNAATTSRIGAWAFALSGALAAALMM